eukprot:TRINITY_DN45990_c0_g1_i1.p1 TRINITY_DN45990_c0_g1~~TRINITY_DN45990_c0_g1_i1.p1  ORF type:complete len:583 (+),score=85.19 TRINITY_DN45990_c0_g1_i1:46-1749(+)
MGEVVALASRRRALVRVVARILQAVESAPRLSRFLASSAALLSTLTLLGWLRHRARRLAIGGRSTYSGGWFELRSPLSGSVVKYLRPAWYSGASVPWGWKGYCPCCKRPVEISPCDKPAPRECLPGSRGCYAYVITLWGASPAYALGALVLGFSIMKTRTKNSLVCLHTSDVPEGFLVLLRQIWDCRLVEHVASVKSLTSWAEPNRFDGVFTKLHCLSLIEFEKVLMLDIDMMVTMNIDDLFDLQAPAALRRGMNESAWRLRHGDYIDGRRFFAGGGYGPNSWGQGTGINAGVMLLQPDLDILNGMLQEVSEPNHPSHCRGNGPEQDYLSRYWADAPWTHIGVQYNFQLHQMFFALQPNIVWTADRNEFLSEPGGIKVIHYSGEGSAKPWCRVLEEEGRGWTDPRLDRAYTLQYAEHFRGYCLWVKRDREWWDSVMNSKYGAGDADGLELGEDGQIYRCPHKGYDGKSDRYGRQAGPVVSDEKSGENGEATPEGSQNSEEQRELVEIPSWATEGTMRVLEWSLRSWFTACADMEAVLRCDVRAALLNAVKDEEETDWQKEGTVHETQ